MPRPVQLLSGSNQVVLDEARPTPARYRDVFASAEFRAIFAAQLLSLMGDQLAKVAVAVLVYSRTRSPLLAAAAFGIGYLPWVAGGPVLAALSDRFPRQTVLIDCDLIRAALITLLVLPGIPVLLVVVVLFAAALAEPPFQAARAGLLPQLLDGDTYVVAQGLSVLVVQLAQVLGFAIGGALVAAITIRGALLADVITFLISAGLVRAYVRHRDRPPASAAEGWGSSVLGGLRLIRDSPVLRRWLMIAWTGAAATVAPEGLMVTYAAHLGGGAATTGLLLSAMPLGAVIGAVGYGRFTAPALRVRLITPMALGACAVLVPAALDPPTAWVFVLLACAGYGGTFMITLQAQFTLAVPDTYRARAYGIAAAGLMIGQGAATLGAGLLAEALHSPARATAICGLCGIIVLGLILLKTKN